MIGRVKRQSGSEATKHPVFPEQGNAVHYGPIGRVVYRGNNNANPNGGVSMSNANNDSSNTNTNIGSRLNNNRKEILIGVQHRGLVPTVVPRGASRSNSGP